MTHLPYLPAQSNDIILLIAGLGAAARRTGRERDDHCYLKDVRHGVFTETSAAEDNHDCRASDTTTATRASSVSDIRGHRPQRRPQITPRTDRCCHLRRGSSGQAGRERACQSIDAIMQPQGRARPYPREVPSPRPLRPGTRPSFPRIPGTQRLTRARGKDGAGTHRGGGSSNRCMKSLGSSKPAGVAKDETPQTRLS